EQRANPVPRRRRHGRRRPPRLSGGGTVGAGRAGGVATSHGGHRRRPRDGGGRPPPAYGERTGRRGDAGGPGDARRRRSGLGAPRTGARPVPARRSADHLGPGIRADARRAHGGGRTGGVGGRPGERPVAVRVRGLGDARSVPLAEHGRSDGRCGVAVDVDVRARGPCLRSPYVLLAQRGPRQGAAVRRLRTRGARAAPMDVGRPRAPAPGRGPRDRPDRRHRDPHADAADGRRGPQPQPRRDADAPAGPLPRDGLRRPRPRRRGRGAPVRRRQRPLLPQPRDAGLQARPRRRARHGGVDDGRGDGPQRHRLRDPGRRHRRRVVHRARAARGL
ncbi:MAG: Uncharacterized protein YahG, partial [uncultured Nocardioidaceae bacterium]